MSEKKHTSKSTGAVAGAVKSAVLMVVVIALVLGLGFGLMKIAEYREAQADQPALESGNIELIPEAALIHGSAQLRRANGKTHIGEWHHLTDWFEWSFRVEEPGSYDVVLVQACDKQNAGSQFEVAVNGQTLNGKIELSANWTTPTKQSLGQVTFDKSGQYQLSTKPVSISRTEVARLSRIKLSRPRPPADSEGR